MIRRIAGKECLQLARDHRFVAAAAIVYLLLCASFLAGSKRQEEFDRQIRQAEATTRRIWNTQGQKNPHAAAHFGMYVFKPQSPLALFDGGVDRFTGTALSLQPHRQNQFQYRPADDAHLTAAGELTPAQLLQATLPLLIILLGFPAIAGERETGSLRLVMAAGISPHTLLWGKAVGLGGAVLMLLAPAGLLALAALAWTSGLAAALAFLPEVFFLSIIYLAYSSIWLALTLAVSARASSSRRALATLLGFWTLSILILPRLAASASAMILPSPTLAEFNRQIQTDLDQGIDGHSPASARAEALRSRVLAQFKVDSVDQLPFHFGGLLLQESEEYGNRVFDQAFSRLWDRYQQQEQLQLAAGFASPLIPLRQLSQVLSATSFQHFRRFAKAAETFRRRWIRFLNQDLTTNAPPNSSIYSYQRDNDFWRAIPAFQYQSPNGLETLQMAWLPAFALLLWLSFSLFLCWRATRRFEVIA